MPSGFRIGDRIRVTIEGELVSNNGWGPRLKTPDGLWHDFENHVGFELVARAKPKVGDVIRGHDAYEALPVGAVLKFGRDVYLRTSEGFTGTDGEHYVARGLCGPRPLVYLPDN